MNAPLTPTRRPGKDRNPSGKPTGTPAVARRCPDATIRSPVVSTEASVATIATPATPPGLPGTIIAMPVAQPDSSSTGTDN